MSWKTVAEVVGKSAPVLGTLLGGPAGGVVGSLIASTLGVGNNPVEVSKAVSLNPEAAVKLAQLEFEQKSKLYELSVEQAKSEIAAMASVVADVNRTMRTEAKAERWPTYGWRPYIGFITGTMVFGVYFVLPLAKVPVPDVPESVWLMLGGILGVASFFRGRMQQPRQGEI